MWVCIGTSDNPKLLLYEKHNKLEMKISKKGEQTADRVKPKESLECCRTNARSFYYSGAGES